MPGNVSAKSILRALPFSTTQSIPFERPPDVFASIIWLPLSLSLVQVLSGARKLAYPLSLACPGLMRA
jgi:hypothetical protein